MNEMTIESMAASLEPWTEAQIAHLDGNIRGSLLRDWGVHVARREGRAAVAAIRAATGITEGMLADSPDLKAWYPCRYQIALTDAIVAQHLAGDYLALEELLLEDGQRARDKVARWIIARVRPETIFRKASVGHAEMMTVGAVAADVQKGRVTVRWDDATVFGNPTWRILQMMATRLMMRVMKKTLVSHKATRLDLEDGFGMELSWR